jgi:hypothetical protein
MKRYILTSPRFAGEINVLYGLDNRLLLIDFMKAGLNDHQIEFFKKAVPVYFTENFLDSFPNSTLNVLEEGYTVSFEMWWGRYNLKHNKARCLALWNKLSEADQVNAYFKLGQYERHLSLNQWKNKADPDTYLRQRYWESEWK